MKLPRPLKAFNEWRTKRADLRRRIIETQARLSIHPDVPVNFRVKKLSTTAAYRTRLDKLKEIERARGELNQKLLDASKHLSEYVPNASCTSVQSFPRSIHAGISSFVGWVSHKLSTTLDKHTQNKLTLGWIHHGATNLGKASLSWTNGVATVEIVGRRAKKKLGDNKFKIPLTKSFCKTAVEYYKAEKNFQELLGEYYKYS